MSAAFYLIRAVISIYDIISYPIYFLIDKPWRVKEEIERPRSKVRNGTWVAETSKAAKLLACSTMAEAIEITVKEKQHKQCLGYRKVLGIETSHTNGFIFECNGKTQDNKNNNNHKKHSNGVIPKKTMPKKILDNKYTWLTYGDVNDRILNLMHGLSYHGVKYLDKVVLILETRMEWSLTAYALIRMGSTLCTMFSTLGLDGYVVGINELDCETIITNYENAHKLLSHASKISKMKKIIVFQDKFGPQITELPNAEGVEVIDFLELESKGKEIRERNDITFEKPRPDDLALIMYTSGTTGVPKGVMFTQSALVHAINYAWTVVVDRVFPRFNGTEVYMAYLPLAHIFEFMMESTIFHGGISNGYGSPFTVLEGGLQLAKDCLPDVRVLNPNLMVAVPLVLERIKGKIKGVLAQKSPIARRLVQFAVEYKNSWNARGHKTRLIDSLLFKKTHDVLGKNLTSLIVGSAPLSEDTHRFLRSIMNVAIIQGYGTTETHALATSQDLYDFRFGTVGFPISEVKLNIRDWHEGRYTAQDYPHPRGELLIGGRHLSHGYFNRPEETKEAFFVDHDDPTIKWFVSGDIVEVDQVNGGFKIIDRKKDLVKLQNGEFISLGKIEAILKDDLFVDNVMVVVPSLHNFVVAVVLPDKEQTSKLVEKLGLRDSAPQTLYSDEKIGQEVLSSIQQTSARLGLNKIETPRKVFIVPDDWTPDSGLVTPSLKIRRKAIHHFYKSQIDRVISEAAGK